jgi:hypothetical protein
MLVRLRQRKGRLLGGAQRAGNHMLTGLVRLLPDTWVRVPGDAGNCLVAIVLDNQVLSAPQIISVITGAAQIAGAFTADGARRLAAKLQHGALPLALEIQSITSS